MGIRTDPGYRLYVTDNLCFPTGKTPKKIYITFSGIKIGEEWYEGMPQPRNGLYVAEYDRPGFWKVSGDRYVVIFRLETTGSSCQLQLGALVAFFQFATLDLCVFSGANRQDTWENNWYYGGNFAAVTRE